MTREPNAPRSTVPARLKMLPHRGYARILCGRETRPGCFDCGGDLGRVYALPLAGQEFNDLDLALPEDEELDALVKELNEREPPELLHNPENLDDPTNYALTTGGDRDFPTLSGLLRLGLSGVTADDLVAIEGGTIGLWVAWHERGYTRLANGDHAVIKTPDHGRQSWRRDDEGRVRGRSDIPDHLLHDVDQYELASASGHTSRLGVWDTHDEAPPKRGLVGARPVLPAVIVCPNPGCLARNAVRRLTTGELPTEAPRSSEAHRRRRVEAAFERDHPFETMGDDFARLPIAERERLLRERLSERNAAYQRWLRDDKSR